MVTTLFQMSLKFSQSKFLLITSIPLSNYNVSLLEKAPFTIALSVAPCMIKTFLDFNQCTQIL